MPKRKYIGTIKPTKIWMKDKESWVGIAIGLRLNKQQCKEFAEMLVNISEKTNKVDVTIYPKKPTPTITITYAEEE